MGAIIPFSLHRVGHSVGRFDQRLVDLSPEKFRSQVRWIKDRFPVINQQELGGLLESGEKPKRSVFLLTFDDGYRDCHEIVLPILREEKVPAWFFITTRFIDERRLGPWELVSFLLATSRRETFLWKGKVLKTTQRRHALNFLMRDYLGRQDPDFLQQLQETTGGELPSVEEMSAQLMTWDQIRELHSEGMVVGGHSTGHEVFSQMSADDAEKNIRDCRNRLQEVLGTAPEAFSFPYGFANSYSAESVVAARRAGFRFVFSVENRIPSLSDFRAGGVAPRLNPVSSFWKLRSLALAPDVFIALQKWKNDVAFG